MTTTPRPPTLNDPPWGPAPLTPGARTFLERLRDQGPLPVKPGPETRLTKTLSRLGYVRAAITLGHVEITERGRLALTPLE